MSEIFLPFRIRPEDPRAATVVQKNLEALASLFETGLNDGDVLTWDSDSNQFRAGSPGIPVPSGTVVDFGGAAAPAGWLLCDGAAVSRITYAALFAAIGTAYGAGDGSTTFNVPNAKGRVTVGLDGAQTEFDTLAEAGGAKTNVLAKANLPTHVHSDGSLAVASHTHGDGTLAVASHAHDDGTLAVASHTHDDGTLAAASHDHGGGVHNHGVNDPGHSHSGSFVGSVDSGANGLFDAVALNAVATGSASTGVTVNNSGAVINAQAPDVTGATGAAAPDVTGSTGAASPDVTGATGAAAPDVAGDTGDGSADGLAASAVPNLQPYLVLNKIIKT